MVGSSTLGQREFFSPPGFGPDPFRNQTRRMHRSDARSWPRTDPVIASSTLLKAPSCRPHWTQVAELSGLTSEFTAWTRPSATSR